MASTMKALVFEGPYQLKLREIARPVPGPGEVLVRVHFASICGTDVRIVQGRKTRDIRYGYPIGHECSGTVAQVGPGTTDYVPGERVSVCVVVSCGQCPECRADRENLCASRITLGYHTAGAFAEYMLIPAHAIRRGNLFKLPDSIALETAALLEPMGCCINGQHEMRRAASPDVQDKQSRRRLAILGAGPIGLLHLLLARACGAYESILMTEPLPHRREQAVRLGADRAVQPDEFRADQEFDDVIIAFGDPQLVGVAMRAARKCGNVNLFAGFDPDARVELNPNLVHYGQLRLTGGSESRRRDYAEALALVEQGRVQPAEIISHRYRLEDFEQAFTVACERQGLKVLFDLA